MPMVYLILYNVYNQGTLIISLFYYRKLQDSAGYYLMTVYSEMVGMVMQGWSGKVYWFGGEPHSTIPAHNACLVPNDGHWTVQASILPRNGVDDSFSRCIQPQIIPSVLRVQPSRYYTWF
jgi:hypothetical protein